MCLPRAGLHRDAGECDTEILRTKKNITACLCKLWMTREMRENLDVEFCLLSVTIINPNRHTAEPSLQRVEPTSPVHRHTGNVLDDPNQPLGSVWSEGDGFRRSKQLTE